MYDIQIIGIFGRHNELGEGKTLFLTYLALKKYKTENKPIYADYTLPFAKHISHISEFVKLKDCSVFLDDAIPFFDSRQSGGNVLETWILNTCRKLGINLFYTAQLKGAIDSRLRKVSNMIVETERVEYPVFHIAWYSKNLNLIDEYNIKYAEDVTEIYKTLEVVKRKVSLTELNSLMDKFKNRFGFRQITKAKFNFKGSIADTVYVLLKVDDDESIKELLMPFGYTLVS